MTLHFGLSEFLHCKSAADGAPEVQEIGGYFYGPGFWTAFAAILAKRQVPYSAIKFSAKDAEQYAQAIGLPVVLGEKDNYPYQRVNEGKNYSRLVLLESAQTTDAANTSVAGCVRHLFKNHIELAPFSQDLIEVIGDLHDNVWSHGKSTGFSMAQLFARNGARERCEFALADCGYGFLRELHRVGKSDITTHAQAIEWCIQKGNSSKRLKAEDPWEQRLPEDAMFNPIPGLARAKEQENHHMGLGLAKLTALVQKYGGTLTLATGDTLFSINSGGRTVYRSLPTQWPGVALACRFDTTRIKERLAAAEVPDELTDELVRLLSEAGP
ncbi:hypothetical protein ACNRBV_23740 [Ralstonia pseudosolanacearum]|nr:hypothetical protein [Ralstonia pseudosolanacearum]BCL90672.1 hypothetical protein MAFF211479_03730 [Ralstonia solanacearum]BCN03236.1 hypothetical protein RPSB_03730 [Ralstonia solanacearum]